MSCFVKTNGLETPINFHNGFAWFLDDVLARLGDDRIPAHLFGQAAGSSADGPGPGDLDVEQAQAFAAAVDAVDNERLEDLMWAIINGRPAEPDMAPAIATLRAIADLARAGHGLVIS